MNFVKRHYEKVLLGLVLCGLTVALALLPFNIASEKEALVKIREGIIDVPVPPLTNLDLSHVEAALQGVQSPMRLDFGGVHNLVNPVPWVKTPDGRLVREQVNKELPVVTRVTPLYWILSFESVGAGGANYLVKLVKETETRPKLRDTSRYLKVNEKIDVFSLREFKGPAENPTALVFDVVETGDQVTVAPGQPYKHIEGYTADLRYDPDKRTWPPLRIGSRLSFAGNDYTIAAINLVATDQFEVVLSHRITLKKTIITFTSPP